MEGQLDEETKQKRADHIMELQADISAAARAAKVGRTLECICDGVDDETGMYLLRTAADCPEIDGNVLTPADTRLSPANSTASPSPIPTPTTCYGYVEGRSKMNLPNKLTLLRVALVPFFMFFAAGSRIGTSEYNAAFHLVGGADLRRRQLYGFSGRLSCPQIQPCHDFASLWTPWPTMPDDGGADLHDGRRLCHPSCWRSYCSGSSLSPVCA